MPKYICVENDLITSVVDYEPNVPQSVSVYAVTDAEFRDMENGTHAFNMKTRTVTPVPQSVTLQKQTADQNSKYRQFLSSTDWIVLRHIRERALGLTPSLSDDKYLELENQRQQAAKSIIS